MAKKKSNLDKFIYFLVAIMALALLLSFEAVGGPVGQSLNIPKVSAIARVVLGTGIGIYLITTGVAALAVPLVGVALIVIGLIIAAYALWPLFNRGGE